MKMIHVAAAFAVLLSTASFASAGELNLKLNSTNANVVGNLAVRDVVKADFSEKLALSDQSVGASIDAELDIKSPALAQPLQGNANVELTGTNLAPVLNVSLTRKTELKDVKGYEHSTAAIGSHVKFKGTFKGD